MWDLEISVHRRQTRFATDWHLGRFLSLWHHGCRSLKVKILTFCPHVLAWKDLSQKDLKIRGSRFDSFRIIKIYLHIIYIYIYISFRFPSILLEISSSFAAATKFLLSTSKTFRTEEFQAMAAIDDTGDTKKPTWMSQEVCKWLVNGL